MFVIYRVVEFVVCNMKKVVARQDDSCHWYVISMEMQEQFTNLLYLDDEYSEFEEKFSKYRTGGSINNVQLYAEIE